MKKAIFIISVFVIMSITISAQPHRGEYPPPPPKSFEKFKQFEKAKLIEIMNMDENTAIKFFARRNESMNRFMKMAKERDDLMDEMEGLIDKDGKTIDNKTYQNYINKLMELENKMLDERKSFINSLDDILTKEQILKFVIFDFRIKNEIKERIKEK